MGQREQLDAVPTPWSFQAGRDMAGIKRWLLPGDTEQSRDPDHIFHWASCGGKMTG